MKKFALLIFYFLIVSIASAQSPAKLVRKCTPEAVLTDSSAYKLVMISVAGCGYCFIAMKELQELNKNPNLSIHIIDYGNKKQQNQHYSQYLSIYNFTEVDACLQSNIPKFFPQFVLYNSENKIIWKKKGWVKGNLEAIKERVSEDQS